MKFKDSKITSQGRYAIGIEEKSGKFYITFPVRNDLVQADEYYEISTSEYQLFSEDLDKAKELVERCRNRQEDERLILQPFTVRGYPC